MNNSMGPLTWAIDVSSQPEDIPFQFLYRTGSPQHQLLEGDAVVTPDMPLKSGETFELVILYSPGTHNIDCIDCFVFLEIKIT